MPVLLFRDSYDDDCYKNKDDRCVNNNAKAKTKDQNKVDDNAEDDKDENDSAYSMIMLRMITMRMIMIMLTV